MASAPFDNRDGSIWMDGKMIPWRSAQVHVLTHALHYGSSVFEGVRIYGGKIFKLKEHTERLFRSAELLGFQIPYSIKAIEDAQKEVVAAQKIVDGYLRPLAWRGSEMMSVSAKGCTTHVAVATWEWPSYFSGDAKERGLRMHIARYARPAPNTAPTESKAAGLYMIATISKQEAEAAGYDDALMYDWRGYLAESTGSNLFLVMKNGEIHTPTPDCFLNGITRQTVMELARKRGVTVVERHIRPQELTDVAEIFVTGTAAEVTPIGAIDGTPAGNLKFPVGPITKLLVADYAALVRA
jgi:branched-chain amino acid aminotransferase